MGWVARYAFLSSRSFPGSSRACARASAIATETSDTVVTCRRRNMDHPSEGSWESHHLHRLYNHCKYTPSRPQGSARARPHAPRAGPPRQKTNRARAVVPDTLSRGRVLQEAVALLDRVGPAGFSIRSLAKHL